MKPWIVAVITFVAGTAIGTTVVHIYWMRLFVAAVPSAIQSIEDKQEYSCVLSLGELNLLEKGEMDRAKSLLAREIGSYYRHPFTQGDSPKRKKLLALIESARANSPALNDELSKPSP